MSQQGTAIPLLALRLTRSTVLADSVIQSGCRHIYFSPIGDDYSANATELYYTTDGSTPTIPPTGTSTLYSSPVSVGVSETLKAIGGATGYNNSAVGSAAYTINLGPTYAAANYPSSGGPATQTLSIPIPAGATVIVSTGSYNGGSAAALSVTDSSGGNTYAETVSYAGSYPGFGLGQRECNSCRNFGDLYKW